MAAIADSHGPFSTSVLWEPLPDLPHDELASDLFQAPDTETLSLDDKLDLSYKSLGDLCLPRIPGLDLPLFPGVQPLPELSATAETWSLSRQEIDRVRRVRLRSWKADPALSIPEKSPRVEDTRRIADPEPAAVLIIELRSQLNRLQIGARSDPISIALIACVSDVLNCAEWLLTSDEKHQAIDGHGTRALMSLLEELITIVTHNDMISTPESIIERLQSLQHTYHAASSPLTAISHLILQRVSVPYIQAILSHVGLCSSKHSGSHRLALPPSLAQDTLRDEIFSREEVSVIQGVHQDLEELRNLEFAHPLLNPEAYGAALPDVSNDFSISKDDAERLAEEYQVSMTKALRPYHAGEPAPAHTLPRQVSWRQGFEDDMLVWADDGRQQRRFACTGMLFTQIPENTSSPAVSAHLQALIGSGQERKLLTAEPESILKPWMPLIKLQSHLVHASLVRHIFETSDLRGNLELLFKTYLLQDGMLSQRLSSLLFDGAEDLVFDAIAGLGLAAGSQTRLALQDLLRNKDIGFSTRQLTPSQFAELVDTDTLHTLELLTLRYTGPRLVHRVVADTLTQYDDLFRFQLRLRRILHVAASIQRQRVQQPSSRAFGIESLHVALALNSYYNSTVTTVWRALTRSLDAMQTHTSQVALEDIRTLHLAAVHALRTRFFVEGQEELDKCIRHLMSIIVKGSKIIRSGGVPELLQLRDRVRRLIYLLERLAPFDDFVNVAHVSTKNDDKSSDLESECIVEPNRFLARTLDYNGFYTQT